DAKRDQRLVQELAVLGGHEYSGPQIRVLLESLDNRGELDGFGSRAEGSQDCERHAARLRYTARSPGPRCTDVEPALSTTGGSEFRPLTASRVLPANREARRPARLDRGAQGGALTPRAWRRPQSRGRGLDLCRPRRAWHPHARTAATAWHQERLCSRIRHQ